ncbi:hypothetical protein ACHAWF_017867 [Thalassiosira exigua]
MMAPPPRSEGAAARGGLFAAIVAGTRRRALRRSSRNSYVRKSCGIVITDKDAFEKGYDSNGEIDPFYDAIETVPNAGVEEEDGVLPATMLESSSEDAIPGEDEPASEEKSEDWFMSELKIGSSNVAELKKKIARRGIRLKCKKTELQQMLQNCTSQQMPIVAAPSKAMKALSDFLVGSKWKERTPRLEVGPEPENIFDMYTPTDNAENLPTVPKQKFDETWDRPEFTGKDWDKNVHLKGRPCADWIWDQGLNVHSHPADWVDAFLHVYKPPKLKKEKNKGHPYKHSVEQLCRWSNERARLMEMGTKSLYPEFKPFSTEEWEKYLYLIFWNGLNPSPSVQQKLATEEEDPIKPSSFIRCELGPNASHRLRK